MLNGKCFPVFLVACISILFLMSPAASIAGFGDEFQLENPVNLGPNINSPYTERGLSVTADGNTMYFTSDRPGGFGAYDLYVSTRVNGVWQPAQNLGAAVNTVHNEADAVVTPDGNRLFFAYGPAFGPYRGYSKIYTSEKVNGVWQPPVELPSSVNRSWVNNNASMVSGDGRWLYWSSFGTGMGLWDIYRVDITDGTYSTFEHLPAPVNTRGRDFASCLTQDGQYLVIDSDTNGSNNHMIYALENIGGIYQPRELLPFPLNGFARPTYSVHFLSLADQETIAYLEFSDAPDTLGGSDFYMAKRILPFVEAYPVVEPYSFNLKSKGKNVTCYIELQDGYSAADIDISTLTLSVEGSDIKVPAEPSTFEVGDNDGDGITDLMVKFDRGNLYTAIGLADGELNLLLEGMLWTGQDLRGFGAVRVFSGGQEHFNEVDPASVIE